MSRAADAASSDRMAAGSAERELATSEGNGPKAHHATATPLNEATAHKVLVGRPALPDWTSAQPVPAFDLRAPELYLNRELTWLQFNYRVLHEAGDHRTPLLERVKFLAIAANNMDEFVMKRVGGLKQQIGAGLQKLTVDGRTPLQQIGEIRTVVSDFLRQQRQVYLELVAHLRDCGIEILRFEELDRAEKAVAREHYCQNVFPLVTPLAMDPAHPFPFLSNLSLNLLVTLRFSEEPELTMARIKVPVGPGVGRFVKVGDSTRFVMLEDVMRHCLGDMFPGMHVESVETFRITRNANTERDEEQADDLLALIEAELRDRKFAPIVRLETETGINPTHRGMLAAELGLNEDDVYASDVMIGMRDLMELAQLPIPELHDPAHEAITNIKLQDRDNIFHIIRENGPILLHHPYDSFATSVTRFVREAASDPKVQAIKMTLYRTSADTNIIDHLIEAARNGKQVAVVVELKARFDEAANLRWAARMEEAGIHVTYGVLGLKTHAKLVLVVRRDYTGLRRYAHIGTGNYHAGTARLYCDLGLLTSDPQVGMDLTELFNYLTSGCRPSRSYRKILAAPNLMKRGLLANIDREIAVHTSGNPGLIRFKANALEDPAIVEALYRASQAGVQVQLIIRDTCRIRPGIPGLSHNISVISIVGRFLEHARIYYFRNSGDEEYYIGSADLMTRNLESRVEVLVPIEHESLRRQLHAILEAQLGDQRGAWEMQADGGYVQRPGSSHNNLSSQEMFVAAAALRAERARRLRKLKPRAFARRAPK
jgi:polyphosphate kinase